MKYTKQAQSGDAGSSLCGFTISHELGWPFRTYQSDLGIDAEMELIDDNDEATGDVVKLQIKAASQPAANGKFSVTVTERHLEYWNRFNTPVVVLGVDLTNRQVYWKQIFASGDYETSGDCKKVTFDVATDTLTDASKDELRKLALPDTAKEVGKKLTRLGELMLAMPNPYNAMDHLNLDDIKAHADRLTDHAKDLEELAHYYPYKFSSEDLSFMKSAREFAHRTRCEIGHVRGDLIEGG